MRGIALPNEMGGNERHSRIAIDNVDESGPGEILNCNEVAQVNCGHVQTPEVAGLSEEERDTYDSPGCSQEEMSVL